jgi:hypothetical protein
MHPFYAMRTRMTISIDVQSLGYNENINARLFFDYLGE